MKQKGSADVKSYLWNYLDKKVLLWHREAPFFLTSVLICMETCLSDERMCESRIHLTNHFKTFSATVIIIELLNALYVIVPFLPTL